jgi:hypothetical protein
VHHQPPRLIANLRPAPYSAGVALCSNNIAPLISSMRPCCTASTELAIFDQFVRRGVRVEEGRAMVNFHGIHVFDTVSLMATG